jgi:hypothetical protein
MKKTLLPALGRLFALSLIALALLMLFLPTISLAALCGWLIQRADGLMEQNG